MYTVKLTKVARGQEVARWYLMIGRTGLASQFAPSSALIERQGRNG
jgi:hypothetical protein